MHSNNEYLQFAHHTLRISNPKTSLSFYQNKLGMTLLAQRTREDKTHYFLGYIESVNEVAQESNGLLPRRPLCLLELIYDPANLDLEIRKQPDSTEGYWKIAISVKDVNIARRRLIANNVDVGKAFEVKEVAYLCHFNDPDGYCVELIQHNFLHNHRPEPENQVYKLGSSPTFLLVTYRIKDPARSLRFYCELLGMTLLSKQVIETRGFTLYFLASTDEVPPNPDIEDVENREWLWKRPYTILELQHIWGTEHKDGFDYRVGPKSGFERISFITNKLNLLLEKIESNNRKVLTCDFDPILQVRTATALDPDGYSVRLIDKG